MTPPPAPPVTDGDEQARWEADNAEDYELAVAELGRWPLNPPFAYQLDALTHDLDTEG